MAKLTHIGIAPNLLLKDVEVTAPFLFQGELDTSGSARAYLEKLRFYKKNLKLLKEIDLAEYFYLCMSAHWATAGTYVPTNVDNQIREGLWKHQEIQRHIEKMARTTLESWKWDYGQVTNRKTKNPLTGEVLSTHEGTWLSVAIGAYCALKKHKHPLQQDMAEMIVAEIRKEEAVLTELREKREAVAFLSTTALMAHNFGDLDRVIDQWGMPADDPFRLKIYKLGHEPHADYSPVLAYAGQVNKAFLSVENHRHMSLRQAKCLRRSHHFLVPVGPFMEEWGKLLGESKLLTLTEKAEIIMAFYEGWSRQDKAFGYIRAFRGLTDVQPQGLLTFERDIPADLMREIKKSKFYESAQVSREEFEAQVLSELLNFVCPVTGLKF